MNRIARMEFHGLELATPWGPARVARALLAGVDAAAGLDRMALDALTLENVTAEIDLATTPSASSASASAGAAWRFEPVAGADGELHAHITDAAWVLDADVTIPVMRGRVDFNRATVEHLGPDSSLALGRSGLHVDAPNGRHSLLLWQAATVPGARYATRGSMLSPDGDRGALELQPFVEALLAGVALATPAAGARDMLARTRLAGQLRLGDGVVGNDRQRAVLTGRADGRNRVELASTPAGAGIGLRVVELAAAEVRAEFAGRVATAATLEGTLALQLADPAGRPAITARIAELTLRGVAVQPAA